jgi:hypothetical protein
MLRRVFNFIGTAALALSLLAPSATTAVGQGPPNVWRLRGVIVANKANNFVTVVNDNHGATGGEVRISLNGRALDLCSGGQEVMEFKWQFTRDIRQLGDGEVIPAQLQAQVTERSRPCNGALAGVSDITLMHSAGATSPLTPDYMSKADSDRFVPGTPPPGINWVRANDGPHIRQAAVAIARGPAKPNGDTAYFSIVIGLRGGGQVWWTYLYDRVGGSSGGGGGGGGGGALTSEPGVDRRGGDYANFELPESDPGACGARCAGDAGCLAYTYVRPSNGNAAHCWLKNTIPPATPSNCCVSGIRAQAPPPGRGVTYEPDTNRGGSDYTGFDAANDANVCRNNCANDGRCKAYTWVKPGVQGASARCYLKSAVPPPTHDTCCVSGVRQ